MQGDLAMFEEVKDLYAEDLFASRRWNAAASQPSTDLFPESASWQLSSAERSHPPDNSNVSTLELSVQEAIERDMEIYVRTLRSCNMEEELKKLQALATQQWGQIRSIADNPQELLRHPSTPFVCTAFVLGIGVGLAIPRLRQPFRRFSTVEDLPNRLFHQDGKIKAVVVNFSDGDTFRARHLPLFRGAGSYDGKLSDHTLQIRLAGIDTPETAKFGNPGQPFGDEAKKWLTSTLEGRKLTLTLLHKDQYARAVCLVQYGRWSFRRDASEEILKVGLGQVYRQAGAVYGGKQEVYEELEEKAKKKKRGIWSQGKKMESSSDYKARMRAS
ncbi:hypothetical protein PI125_g26658 [Phytophthora idaei]|nr:hypothetical protein PI125_g26658 [Phytophthora idaei]